MCQGASRRPVLFPAVTLFVMLASLLCVSSTGCISISSVEMSLSPECRPAARTSRLMSDLRVRPEPAPSLCRPPCN